ncbi:MAG: DNA-binding transcriptional regulator [Kiritimatiellae bacterium]|nr:DNA-binding transcriptional regulator [Kiritimatiellia bacterium]
MKIAVLTECSSEYGRRLIDGVAAYANCSHSLRLTWINPNDKLNSRTFDGCQGIIARIANDNIARQLKRTGLPVVDVFCQREYPGFFGVNSDHKKIGFLAAEHFIAKQHKNFAFVGFKGVAFSNKRRQAFSDVLARHGFNASVKECSLVQDQRAFFNTDISSIINRDELKSWLKKLSRPVAVFAANDLLALNVMQLAEEVDIDVPTEMAILGVDDDRLLCAFAKIPLSSIDPNAYSIGFSATRVLTTIIKETPREKPHPIHHVSPKGIAERASTECHAINPEWLADALGQIDSALNRPFSTIDLVELTGHSHVTISKTFRQKLGMTPLQYITQVKMKAAKKMLDEGKYLVKEVAAKTGYQSLSRFCIVYKAFWGHSPTCH